MMIMKKDHKWNFEGPPESLNVEDIANPDILLQFPRELRNLIAELWRDGNVGICAGNLKITEVYGFQEDTVDKVYYADSFTLSVPFAGHFLMWEVIFSHKDLLCAPDFSFGDESFWKCPNLLKIVKTNVPSWNQWNPNDPKALITLIREFHLLYKKHHVNLLINIEKYSRFCFEYSSLVGETGVKTNQVEVLVEPCDVFHFLISLPINFSSLPPYIQENSSCIKNSGPDAAMLLVTFRGIDGSKVEPSIFLSPHVEQVLGSTGNKFIFPFQTHGCLMDYVPEVRRLLVDKVESIATNHKMKKEYISHVVASYGCSVLEYDILKYANISLLFEIKNFYWMLIVNLGCRFPQEKPKFILRSVYHMTDGKPYMEPLDNYPYSPRWNPEEMIQRAFSYIFDNIASFQNASILKSHI